MIEAKPVSDAASTSASWNKRASKVQHTLIYGLKKLMVIGMYILQVSWLCRMFFVFHTVNTDAIKSNATAKGTRQKPPQSPVFRFHASRPCGQCKKKGYTECIDGCESCRKGRVPCIGGQPCQRCRDAQIKCIAEPSTPQILAGPVRNVRVMALDRVKSACQNCRKDNKKVF